MLRHSVVPLLLDHCKANFCALTGTPLTLETVTTFLFQLDYYSTFNTSPSQITRDAAFVQSDRAFYHPVWLLPDKDFNVLVKCLGLRKDLDDFVAPFSVSPLIGDLHCAIISTCDSLHKESTRIDVTLDDDTFSAKGPGFAIDAGVGGSKNEKKKTPFGVHLDVARGRCILCCEVCERHFKQMNEGKEASQDFEQHKKGQGMKVTFRCSFCKVFLCVEKRDGCGGRTCFDVHHCDYFYPLAHPMNPEVIGAQASRFVSIVATPVKKKKDDDEDEDGKMSSEDDDG